jgi:hypothetical protein
VQAPLIGHSLLSLPTAGLPADARFARFYNLVQAPLIGHSPLSLPPAGLPADARFARSIPDRDDGAN